MPLPIAYAETFTPNVIAGFFLTFLAAIFALVVTTWWSYAEDRALGGPPPGSVRGLFALAFALWVIGIFWQLIGYLRMEWAGW